MKKIRLLQTFALAVGLMISTMGWGQATLPLTRTSWGTPEPTGWTNSGCTQRTSSFACSGNDGTIFDSNGDSRTVFFSSAPNQLVFKLKKSSMSGESKIVLEESSNGTSWTTLGNYGTATGATTITDCGDITITLNASSRYIKWTYTKATGNCDMDDVSISAATGTPDIVLSDNGTQVTAADVNQGTTAHILHKFQLAISTANASLTGMTCTTAGSYVSADITNLKVRYSADATLDAGDATLSTYTTPGIAGDKTFPSFTSQSISSGATGYIFITADIASTATHNNTISLNAITTSNLTFASGNKTGSTTAGGAQTIKDVTGPIVSVYSPLDNATGITINSDLVLTFNENIQKGTGNITIKKIADNSTVQTIDVTSGDVTVNSTTLTINPPSDLSIGTRYYINIASGALQDLQSNNYAGIADNSTWNFTTVAPTVTNVTSTNADGYYKIGDPITVNVTFTDPVTVAGTPRILLEMGTTDRFANYTTGSGTSTISLVYPAIQTGDNNSDLDYVATGSLGLNSGTINSSDGIAATLTLPAPGSANSIAGQKAIIVDGVLPTVSTYSPTDGNTSVTVNQNLILTFTENVKVGSAGNIVIYNGVGTAFETIPYNDARVSFSTNTVTIDPSGTFSYSSDYYVQIANTVITDMAGNAYAGISNATTWNFTTECGPITSFPYSIDFSTYLPTCWSETAGLLAAPSTLSGTSSTWAADGYANNGTTGSARINIFGTTAKEWLITPTIDLGSTIDYLLEFDVALTDFGTTGSPDLNGIDDKFAVVISTDNGTTWTSANTLALWDNAGSGYVYNNLTPAGTHVSISLASYTGQIKIGFYGESTVSNADNDLFIDNVIINELASEPANHATAFSATANTTTQITVNWTDATGGQLPSAYLVKAAIAPATPTAPVDGTPEGDATLIKNINQGTQQAVFTGLEPSTSYNFAIWPYTNSGANIDYKLGSQPTASGTTLAPLGTPVATAATAIITTGFTANWNAAASATSYRLDVSEYETFATAGSNMTDLIISEYIDGSSGTNKAIEIFNGTGASVNLSNYKIWIINNGGDWPETTINLTGILENGDVFVVTNGTDYTNLTTVSDLSSGSLSFNGDDAVGLAKDISGTLTLIDAIGQSGADPGTGWDVAGISNATADRVLTRKSSVSSPNTDWDTSRGTNTDNSEWIVAAGGTNNDASGFGSHTFSGGSSPSFVTGYNNLTVNGTSQSVFGLTPNDTYFYRVRATNGVETSSNSNVISLSTYSKESAGGNWNNSGNWSPPGVPASTDNVLITGLVNVDVTDASVNNINVQDGGELTINASQSLTVSGTITIEDGGSFINEGTLGNGAKGDADAVMERQIPAYTNNANGWHLLASPVNNMVIAGSDFAPGIATPNFDDFYAWDEVNYLWLNQKLPANNITSFVNGKGYLVAYESTNTRDFEGTFNSASITFEDLSKTTNKGNGWHLLGNPFQSALKWETANWGRTNMGPGAKIMNPGGTYTDITVGGANEYIPANQGFFVQALDADNAITIPAASRTHNSTPFYKSEIPSLLTLRAADGEFYVETWIQMMEGSTAGFDQDYDVRFFGGVYNAPQLYSKLSETERVSTNRISDFEEELVIPLGFKSFLNREFTFTASNAASFGENVEVYLVDAQKGTRINLKTNPAYTFTAVANELTERFSIHLLKSTSVNDVTSAEGLRIYSFGSEIFIYSSENPDVKISVFNITGQQVYSQRMALDGPKQLTLNVPTGWYVVKVVTGQTMVSRKVFIR